MNLGTDNELVEQLFQVTREEKIYSTIKTVWSQCVTSTDTEFYR